MARCLWGKTPSIYAALQPLFIMSTLYAYDTTIRDMALNVRLDLIMNLDSLLDEGVFLHKHGRILRALWLIHGYMYTRVQQESGVNVYHELVQSCNQFQRVYYESLSIDASIALAWGDVKSATQAFESAYLQAGTGEHENGRLLHASCLQVVFNHLCRDSVSLMTLPNWRGAVHADIAYLTGCFLAGYSDAANYRQLYDRCSQFVELYRHFHSLLRHHEWRNTLLACQRFITVYTSHA